MGGALAPHSVLRSSTLETIGIAARPNLSGRLLTTASNDKKLYETPSPTRLEAGPELDGCFNRIQAVDAVGPFVDDKVSGR